MFRTLILFALVIISMRIMGKRQIGELQPYELVVLIMISALAAIPMEDIAIPLFNSIIPIILLMVFQVLTSYAAQRSEKVRTLVCLDALEAAVPGGRYLLNSGFTAADIMMGYPVFLARRFGVLTADNYPNVNAYLARLETHAGFIKSQQ